VLSNDRIRVGLIGVGDHGLELLSQIRACSNAEVVALTDIYASVVRGRELSPSAATFRLPPLAHDRSIDARYRTHHISMPSTFALRSTPPRVSRKTLANTVEHAKRMRRRTKRRQSIWSRSATSPARSDRWRM
jgi:hypothetical protein